MTKLIAIEEHFVTADNRPTYSTRVWASPKTPGALSSLSHRSARRPLLYRIG